jgi:hypothetical protein
MMHPHVSGLQRVVLVDIDYAPGAVMVNDVTVIVCPMVTLVLSTVMSPPPAVRVTVPCMWQVVPDESMTRKYPVVCVAIATTCQVPLLALAPPEAAAIQSEGHGISAIFVPVAAAAQFAGRDPDQIWRRADVPTVLSNWSRIVLRYDVENWRAIKRVEGGLYHKKNPLCK